MIDSTDTEPREAHHGAAAIATLEARVALLERHLARVNRQVERLRAGLERLTPLAAEVAALHQEFFEPQPEEQHHP